MSVNDIDFSLVQTALKRQAYIGHFLNPRNTNTTTVYKQLYSDLALLCINFFVRLFISAFIFVVNSPGSPDFR